MVGGGVVLFRNLKYRSIAVDFFPSDGESLLFSFFASLIILLLKILSCVLVGVLDLFSWCEASDSDVQGALSAGGKPKSVRLDATLCGRGRSNDLTRGILGLSNLPNFFRSGFGVLVRGDNLDVPAGGTVFNFGLSIPLFHSFLCTVYLSSLFGFPFNPAIFLILVVLTVKSERSTLFCTPSP